MCSGIKECFKECFKYVNGSDSMQNDLFSTKNYRTVTARWRMNFHSSWLLFCLLGKGLFIFSIFCFLSLSFVSSSKNIIGLMSRIFRIEFWKNIKIYYILRKLPLIGSGLVPKIFEETPPGGARTFEVGLAMPSICCGVFEDISLKIY